MHKEHCRRPFSNACDLVRPPLLLPHCHPPVFLSSLPPPGHPRPEEDPHNNQPPEQLNWPQLIFGFVAITLYYLLQGSDPIPEVAFPFFLQQMLNTGEVRWMADVKVLSGTPHGDTYCTACIVHIVHCTASLWMWGRGDTDTWFMHACICTSANCLHVVLSVHICVGHCCAWLPRSVFASVHSRAPLGGDVVTAAHTNPFLTTVHHAHHIQFFSFPHSLQTPLPNLPPPPGPSS